MNTPNIPPKRRMIGLYMQEELHDVLQEILVKTNCESVSKFVRNAIFEKAIQLGIDISGIENPSRGVRRDLAAGDIAARERQAEILKKARAVQAAKRAEASARKLKTAERIYEERISDKSR